MKIYIDFNNFQITKKESDVMFQGDVLSNAFELLFYNYSDTSWFPTMSQLAPNGRQAGDFAADPLEPGESQTVTIDGVTYLKYKFTIGPGWCLVKGKSNFFIWKNTATTPMTRKCIGRVMVTLNESTETYFIDDVEFNPKVKNYIDAYLDEQNEAIAQLGTGEPKYFDTAANIALLEEDKGLAVATDTGYLFYWDVTEEDATKYKNSGLQYTNLSAYYTKTESNNTFAPKSNAVTFSGNQLQDYSGNNVYPNINADSIPSGALTKSKLNNNVFNSDGIKMNGVTFVANQNRVSMVIYFERTGNMEINVKGTLADGLAQTIIKIGHSTSNTALNPTLQYSDIITDGEFNKTYNVNYSDPYVCVLFEVAVSSYTYYDGLLNIVSPSITINNELMSSYSNIVFKNYTPSSYYYMITGLPNIVSNEYVEEYVQNFYNVNTLPYLEKHNVISVSTAQELVNAINSIATNADNNKATKLNRYDIYLASGTYELYDVIDKSDISEHTLYKRGLEIPDYVNLYGVGEVTISLTLPTTESDTNVRALSTISVYGENHFENIKFTITNGRYCVHDDDGGKYKDRIISFKNCKFIHNGNTIGAWPQTYCIGAGYTGGRKGIYKNCVFDSTTIPFYMHTSSNYYMTNKCFLSLDNCVFRTSDATKPSVDIQDPYGATNEGEITINNCYLNTKLLVRGTIPFVVYGGGNNDFGIDNTTTTPSKIYIVGNSNSDFTS